MIEKISAGLTEFRLKTFTLEIEELGSSYGPYKQFWDHYFAQKLKFHTKWLQEISY